MIVQWVNKWNLGLFNKNLNIKYFSININNNLDNKDLRFNNTIDCFDKLKAYYQAKNKKKVFFKNIQNYKQFLINIKKAKLTYNESKIFIRNGILSSCVISNIVYVIKILILLINFTMLIIIQILDMMEKLIIMNLNLLL